MEINFQFVHFKEGLAWSAGQYYKQSPDNPKRYILVENPKLPNASNQPKK
jgi:hypothetical protein